MALLDDLKSQAADIKATEAALRAEQQAQEEFYTLSLRPVMIKARDYFDEIIRNLCIIDPSIECSYPFDPISQVARVAFTQSEYSFDYDDSRNPHQLYIRCICRLQKPTEFYVPTKEGVEQYAKMLNDYALPFHQKNQLDKRYDIRGATFILDEALPTQIRVLSSPVDHCIYVDFRNFEETPFARYRFNPDQLTIEMLEKIARVLLRKEAKLVSFDVSEEFRGELQKQLEVDRLTKEKDVAEGLSYLEVERQGEEEARLINRTKSALSSGTQRVVAAISSAGKDLQSKK
jgi:hypothetical protein